MKPSKLVLLPGLDGTGAMFAPFIHALPKDVLAEPVAYPESLESFDEYVEFAAAALHGTADVVVIAESFSGPIAISLLRKPPPNLRAIVLVATFTTAPRALLRRLSKLVPSAVIRAFVPAALNWFCANRNTASEVLRIASDVVSREPIETLESRLRLLEELPIDLRALLDKTKLPVLILEPTQDRLVPLDGFVRCAAPNAQLQKIAGPHFLLQSCPKECWEAIEKFLATRSLYFILSRSRLF